MPMNDKYDAVLNGINEYLRVKLSQLSSECSEPGGNPDTSDSTIRQLTDEIKRLRIMREEFENTIAGLSSSYSNKLGTGDDTVYKPFAKAE